MKKKTALFTIVFIWMLTLAACASGGKQSGADSMGADTQENEQTMEQNEKQTEEQPEKQTEEVFQPESETVESEGLENNNDITNRETIAEKERVVDGYTLVDGGEEEVHLTIGVDSVLKGEEAYQELYGQNKTMEQPDENHEYVIVTLHFSYDDGAVDELSLMENRASLPEAKLYFALSNSESNAEDMTSYLQNSAYNISLSKGQSAQGAVAFLQEKGNKQPLYFVGFGQTVEFQVNGDEN